MISKYSLATLAFIMNLLLFSSCLDSSDDEFEYSPDAQIYAFSLSSEADTTGHLSSTAFTIDQINGKIFNKEPLPYLFHVDSALLNIRGTSTYNSFYNVILRLHRPDKPDSSYFWVASDSVDITRLYQITTTAPDGITQKTYNFQLNIYQQDPYILNWENIAEHYLTTSIDNQKTVAFNNHYITYYTSGGTINAVSTPDDDGTNWNTTNLSGLPSTIRLPSLTTSDDYVFALDADGTVYRSTDGIDWVQQSTPYPIVAIYGALPSATRGDMLVAVNDNNTLKFAETDDFSDLQLMNDVPDNIPVRDFFATEVESPYSYAIQYIIISGGTKTDNSANNDICILQEKEGTITHLISRTPGSLALNGSSLFFYDNKLYLMTSSSEKNSLFYSDDFGLDWTEAEDNQALPAEFDNRTNASVITDKNNYIWIFGGVSTTQTQLDDVWKGRINKFAMN